MLKHSRKLLSFLLIIALLTGLLPMQIFAAQYRESLLTVSASAEATAATESGNIVAELTDSRDAYTKQFLLDNGNTMAVQYAIPVHFQNSTGAWVQYDNRMTETTAADSTPEYRVIQSDRAIRLSKKTSEKKQVTIEKDGHEISWGFSGINKVNVRFVEDTTSFTGNDAFLTLEGVIQEARYEDAFSNVDLQYLIMPTGVKENIILKSADVQNEFELEYKFHKLTATQTDPRNITLSDQEGNTVYTITAPNMFDSNGVWSNGLTLTIVEAKENKLTVKLTADAQWLGAAERSFPVTVDPFFNTEKAWGAMDSTTIVSGHPSTAYGPNSGNWIGSLYVGYEPNSSFKKTRSLVRLNNLPELSPGDVIVDAQLCLLQNASYPSIRVYAHQVTTDWNMATATWNSMNANYNPTIEDYDITTSGTTNAYNYWDVTNIVRKWYDGTAENHGLMLISPSETASSMARVFYFASTFPNSVVVRPTFQLTYRNHNGLESYWDYTSASAGRAGTGYVNSYTGNLVWTRADMGFGGNRAPVSISHIYNSNDAGENLFGMGYGWRTNYNQRVYVWDKDTDFYIWEDEDGTDHYFEKQSDGTFKDEDGLELTLTDTGSGNEKYIIQDKNGNKTYFDTLGRLTKISNNQETVSSITVSYTAADSLRIATVTDGVGRVYHYTYNTDNLLTCLSYRGTGMTDLFAVTYGYTDGMLTAVTDQDGKTASYTYNTDYHYLTSATDIDGYKITYEYTQFAANKPSRVSRVQEFDGTASGGVLTIGYGMNETTFTDKLGNVQILQFNNWGNTKSIQDGEGRAQFAQYATDKSDTGKGNQLSLSSKLQNTVVNMITDGSFESTSTTWSSRFGTSTTYSPVSGNAYMGSKSLSIPADGNAAASSFTAELGVYYTFSAYVKGNSTVQLVLELQDDGFFESEPVQLTGEWTRIQVSAIATERGGQAATPIILNTGTGTVYVDCAQLEKAPTASRYNLMQNGDFQSAGLWYTTNHETGDGRKDVTPAPTLGGKAYGMAGNPSKQKNIYQTVSVSGSAGDSFVLGGWAKGDAVPIKENRAYGLYAIFNYSDSTKSEAMMAAFNPDTNGWQYTATAIVAEKDYSSITVYACYDRGANTVYFDGIQLFKEAFGTSYTYDPETGNVVSVIDLQNKETTYEYDGNDLTKIMQDDKVKMTYTYDDWHNVETATTEEGLSYAFVYDTFGNNTMVSIVDNGISISSTADYTDDGNRLESVTDALGNTTIYDYDSNTNVLNWVQYPEDTPATRTNYTYDNMYRMATAAATTDSNLSMSASYTYTDDYLTKIQTPTTTYNFTYGNFGLRSAVKVGSQNLATYTYDSYNRLEKLDYGNQDSVQYTYDTQGRVIQELYEDGATVTYSYDNTGALATVTDSETGITTTYYYDLIDRLVKYEEKGTNFSHSVTYIYDEKNNLSSLTEVINGVKTVYTYAYDNDNRVTSVTVGNGTTVISSVSYTYDAFGRMSQQVTKHGDSTNGTTVLTESATFNPGNTENSTSGQIASYNGFTYTYDANGNILSVYDGTNTTTYEYDSANQLTRENNQQLGITQTWTYNNAGNILTRKEYAYTTGSLDGVTPTDTVNYTYGNSNWGDLLTAYDGATITYDQIGNPLNDGTWTYIWQHGRQLASMSQIDKETQEVLVNWEYTYNADGLRTKRTNGTTTYNYVYNGSQLAQMTTDGYDYHFAYDASGVPLSVTVNNYTYYYVTNLQGDVVGILNEAGVQVTTYYYDAWGNVTYTSSDPIAEYNPLRYRGYVYDTETGLYYLQSRYYDPEIGRFINGDAFAATGQGFIGNNSFVYCLNSPINRVDRNGLVSEEEASEIIKKYADEIIAAGEEFGVDPVAIAACIYIEQVLNVNWIDYLTDYFLSFFDTSIGIGQVRVSTAIMLDDKGYIEKTNSYTFDFIFSFEVKRERVVASKLTDDETNIRYVAAYLKYWQDTWAPTKDISGRIDILTTLYNLGVNAKAPNKNPQPGDFGKYYLEHEVKIRALLK